MPDDFSRLRLAVARDGAGWHPAGWREPDARPAELFTARYWVDLVTEAERGLVDLVTIEDSFGLQSQHRDGPDGRRDRVRGRLDAVLVAARVAPLTRHIGLLPAAVVTHTEPFHLAKAITTLDYVSRGRAGLQVRVSARPDEYAHVGRRTPPDIPVDRLDDPGPRAALADLFDEAADYVEVLRRLWDSWEDDAEIREVATGRFIDRDKLHYIDFAGRWFRVRGPSITPRPPQGQPIVAALAHRSEPYRLAARAADLAFVTPHGEDDARRAVEEIRRLERESGPRDVPVRVFSDLVVFLDDTAEQARARKDRLDARAGAAYASDADIFVGTPGELADRLLDWPAAGLAGFRLRPGTLPHDLLQITRGLVPDLRRRSALRPAYPAPNLRARLGLARPANRYALSDKESRR